MSRPQCLWGWAKISLLHRGLVPVTAQKFATLGSKSHGSGSVLYRLIPKTGYQKSHGSPCSHIFPMKLAILMWISPHFWDSNHLKSIILWFKYWVYFLFLRVNSAKSAFWLGQNVPKILQSFRASSGAQVSQTAPELLFPSLDGFKTWWINPWLLSKLCPLGKWCLSENRIPLFVWWWIILFPFFEGTCS